MGINLIETSDGGFALLGYTSSFGTENHDIYLIRLNAALEPLWSQTFGGEAIDNGWDLIETPDHGFAIVGFSQEEIGGDYDLYLLRTDAAGNQLWEHRYGGPEDEYGWAMTGTLDGGFVLAGQTTSFGAGDEDVYLVRVNDQGEVIWETTYGGEESDRVFSIAAAQDGGFVVAGITRSLGAGGRDAYILKVDAEGHQEWEQVIGEAGDDVAHAIGATDDGGYIVTGYRRSFAEIHYNTLLVRLSSDGDVAWQTVFGGEAEDRTISGEQTEDGGYILAGYTRSFGALGLDLYVVKTNTVGEV